MKIWTKICSITAPPPPPAAPTVPTTQDPKPSSSGGSKVKMTDYMKLGAPQFDTGDDPFVYLCLPCACVKAKTSCMCLKASGSTLVFLLAAHGLQDVA